MNHKYTKISEQFEKWLGSTLKKTMLFNQSMMVRHQVIFIMAIMGTWIQAHAQSSYGWYTEGDDYQPAQRVRFTITNPLDIPLENCPIVIRRQELPIQNIPERWINIVDPNLESSKEPTHEELMKDGGYVRRKETNGHYLDVQVDDLDKDGVWDEIFFMTELAPKETREFYVYIGAYERGMTKHLVHAAIGNYGRHTVPLWESEYMGWKLWYPHGVDLHGKREPMLTAYYEYANNKSGYYMPWELGTDIMTVASTFGSGSMGLFEDMEDMETVSRPNYSPAKDKGPIIDTRYAFDVVFNGPLRSQIKVTTTNWNSGQGFYEMEQFYTAVAHKSWSTVEVKYTEFLPPSNDVMFGAGIRQIMEEYKSINKKGIAISMGKNIEARIPDEDLGEEVLVVPWQGIGLVVKDEYLPKYVPVEKYGGNHLFALPVTQDLSYEFRIFGGWSFGTVNNDEKSFVGYVEAEAKKYNTPPVIKIHEYEKKPSSK